MITETEHAFLMHVLDCVDPAQNCAVGNDEIAKARGIVEREAKEPEVQRAFRHKDLLAIEERCSVTAFDMRVQLMRDGSERGLWIFLEDSSEGRDTAYKKWLDSAVEMFILMMNGRDGVSDKALLRFCVWMTLHSEVGKLLNGKLDEGLLLEWPAVKRLHRSIGREIPRVKPKAPTKRKRPRT